MLDSNTETCYGFVDLNVGTICVGLGVLNGCMFHSLFDFGCYYVLLFVYYLNGYHGYFVASVVLFCCMIIIYLQLLVVFCSLLCGG